ncbi:hypothetical protein CY34DRAFT_34569, partial [Suillus luteus UH-Slu-Lm8-n1]
TQYRTMRGHTDEVRGIVHLPGRRRIITCSNDSSLRQWDLESGAQIGGSWQHERKFAVRSMALSPNGENVLSGCADGTMRVWDVEVGIITIKWVGDAGSVWSLCWSPDGKRLVSGFSDGAARVRDVKSGKTVVGPIKTGHESVLAIVCSPADDTKFATVGYHESAVKIWDSKTG